ncbi:MAG: hypothetical protein WBM37_09265 [Nitrososphaeraceae archaeon]
MCDICKRQELERAYKALRLNGDFTPIYNPRLLAASVKKPTLHIKRLRFAGHSPYNIKLRTASSMRCPEELRKERENAEKALSLNCGF